MVALLAMTAPRARHWEWQYLELMRRIWAEGDERQDRTGVGTRSIFGTTLRFDLAGGRVPLLTTKRVYWKTAAREILWFLTGDTNIRPLLEQGVTIWSDWPLARFRRATGEAIGQEAFEGRIVADEEFARRWGELGPVYGRQWVDWPTYEPTGDDLYRRGKGINQVAQVVESLRAHPGSRRHIIEGWNVAELDAMALPPCHKTYQFPRRGGRGRGAAQLPALPAQLRRGARPAVQPVRRGAAHAHVGAANRILAGRARLDRWRHAHSISIMRPW